MPTELKDGEVEAVHSMILGRHNHKLMLRLIELDHKMEREGELNDEELDEFLTGVRVLAYRFSMQYYQECSATDVFRNIFKSDEIEGLTE